MPDVALAIADDLEVMIPSRNNCCLQGERIEVEEDEQECAYVGAEQSGTLGGHSHSVHLVLGPTRGARSTFGAQSAHLWAATYLRG